MKEDNKIILPDSDEAAIPEIIMGWKSRNGNICLDQSTARWAGSTHKECKSCGNIYYKNSYCKPCNTKRLQEEYDKREYLEWDNKTPLYSYICDEYFFNVESLEEFLHEEDLKTTDLNLVVCEPVYANCFDYDDYWYNDLPEDMLLSDVCPEIVEAAEKLNEVIGYKKHILSWIPGKHRTSLELLENNNA